MNYTKELNKNDKNAKIKLIFYINPNADRPPIVDIVIYDLDIISLSLSLSNLDTSSFFKALHTTCYLF